MARLGVNIDHVATLRQSRGGTDPDPLTAAILVELAGGRWAGRASAGRPPTYSRPRSHHVAGNRSDEIGP